MRRQGFTLIEVMIALAIVAMLAGIVLPIGLSRLNADSFIQTQRQLESAVSIARADAQRRGVLMKLIAVEAQGVVAVWSVEFGEAGGGARGEMPKRREFVLELPSGAGVEPAPAAEDEAEDTEEEEDERPRPAAAGAEAEAAPVERALCVLMPDGTVVAGEAMVLRGRDGKRVRIDFNAWTGALTFVPVEPELTEDADALPPPPSPRAGREEGSP